MNVNLRVRVCLKCKKYVEINPVDPLNQLVITKFEKVIKLLEAYVENLDLKYKSEYDVNGKYGASYSIYIGIDDENVFKFKR